MKKGFVVLPVLLVTVLALFLLSGCPYSSSVPLGPPSKAVDGGLYGKWFEDSGDENPSYYDIEELDGTSFTLSKYTWDSEESSYSLENRYAAWFTPIDDVPFMNVEDVEDRGTYYFYKLEMRGDNTFLLYEVTSNIDEVFTDSKELYKFFNSYKNLSFFYNSDEVTYNRE